MKESIKELAKECINYVDVGSLLKDLHAHIKSEDAGKGDIQLDFDDVWEVIYTLNKLSLEDLKQFISALEDEFVVYLLTLPQSFKTKLYDQINMESCV